MGISKWGDCMRTIIEEYGMFMISVIVFAALIITLAAFKGNFKDASTSFIQSLTGANAQYTE